MGSIAPDPSTQNPAARAWWSLVRFGFRLLYNEMAFTYDTVSQVVSLGQWRSWQRAALNHLDHADGIPAAPLLELAHGTGNFALDLRAAGYAHTAIDLSPAMGRITRRKLTRRYKHADLTRARAQRLPFPTGTFAAAVSTFPTEFIIDPDTLREIHRVLTPTGRLVVVMNGVLTRDRAADRALEWAYRVTGQRGPWPVDVEGRIRAAGFTPRIVTETLPRSQVLLLIADKSAPHSESAADHSGS